MGLGVYFSEDIAQILAGLASAGDRYGPDYHKALADVALAMGIRLPSPIMTLTSSVRVIHDDTRLSATAWD